jgi:hypothetical protein
MEQRNISYYELAELEDEFIKQVTERGIIFPNDDLKSECYFDFVQQYIGR